MTKTKRLFLAALAAAALGMGLTFSACGTEEPPLSAEEEAIVENVGSEQQEMERRFCIAIQRQWLCEHAGCTWSQSGYCR